MIEPQGRKGTYSPWLSLAPGSTLIRFLMAGAYFLMGTDVGLKLLPGIVG